MKKIILILAAITLLSLTACAQRENTQELDETELPEVVAKIDGEEIKRDELLNFQIQMNSEDMNLNLTETLDQLINRKILVQEAKKRGYEATKKDVEATLIKQGFSIKDTKELLDAQDINYEEYIEGQLDTVLFIQMIEKEMRNITITDEEAKQFFEEQKKFLRENASYKDVEEEIKGSLKEQKATERLSRLISEKLETSSIRVFI